MNKKILNIDFVVDDKERFYNQLDKMYRDGVISKFETVLEEDYN